MKINEILLNKLKLQAEEAKEQGITKLAEGVCKALDSTENSSQSTSYEQLKEAMYEGIWKCALDVFGYHDLESVDIQKLDETIVLLAENTLMEIEKVIDKEDSIGPNEEPLIGQKL